MGIYEQLSTLNIKRDTIFVSLSSKDKEIALKILKHLKQTSLKFWCMFDENGNNTNIGGDIFSKTIPEALSRSCFFLWLISQNSLHSNEVQQELNEVMKTNQTREMIKVFPIILDETEITEISFEASRLANITTGNIVRQINSDSSDAQIKAVCDEIRGQYISKIFENVVRSFNRSKNARKFRELMDMCIKNTCFAQPVSEDIKDSAEISAATVDETHILSNELISYDCNTYSCMIIASNLLGNIVSDGVKKYYDPKNNGVKYYYYYTKEYKNDLDVMIKKIRSFVAKDIVSRQEVVSMIIRDFCFRKKVLLFFEEFNGKTCKNFKEQFHIVLREDEEKFDELFNSEVARIYFSYTDTDDVFKVPEEIFEWMMGDYTRADFDTLSKCVYEFVSFINKFVAILENAKEKNGVAFNSLKIKNKELQRMRDFAEWQMGRAKLSQGDAVALVDYLLNYSIDEMRKSDEKKKFPRLENWMKIEVDDKNGFIKMPDEIVESALDNLIPVEVEENDSIILCYSFALFLSEMSGMTGAWYTTGKREMGGRVYEMVMTNNITSHQSKEYLALLDCFAYLLAINKNAYSVLEKTKSKLLKSLSDRIEKYKKSLL